MRRLYAYEDSCNKQSSKTIKSWENVMSGRDGVLCYPVRTAIGSFNGTLKDTPAAELGAIVVRQTLQRSELDPARVGSVS